MMRRSTQLAAAFLLALTSACASAPRDAGFGDVSRAVAEQARQPLKWDPSTPVTPADDAAIAAALREELTADRAVEIAFAHNRDLQASLEELGVARADLLAATTIRNPVFHIEARFPGDPKIPIEFGLVQTLVDIINRGNRKKAGQARFEMTRDRVTGGVVNFAAAVRMDYFELLAARRVLARHQTMLAAQEAATELAQRQHAAGNLDDLDFENEQARYETVKLEHARVQLAELQAREQLFRDLGLQGPVELDLPDDFPTVPKGEISREELERQIVARRLDLQIARAELQAAAAAAGVAKTEWLDELALGVHYEREPDGKRTMGPELEIPIPLFDRGSPARQRARAQLRQVQQRYAALAVNARSQAREAYEALLEARSRMTYMREVVVPRRQRILQLTLTRYNAMLVGPYELLQARQNLAGAEREEVVATRDYWRARTGLDTTLAGVSRFSVRGEGGEPRATSLAAPPSQQETKEH
jgi:cobalt-zinc-cadmium efflux system outer membrane protein